MDSIKWKTIKETFSAALELPESGREARLEKVPADIREEVEKLLIAHKLAENFIEKPVLVAQGIADDPLEDKLIGTTIEKYLILEKIGSGGMGAVYLAERVNSDFKQKVAIKVIKRGMDSDAILKRFANERRILSSLKHPNIAQLLDGGISSENLPFFVMEFVEGEPLTEFCNRQELSIEERLGIFRSVCSAVEHAHKNLVIHRDLKPTNIIVNEDRVSKLLDFGIAKLLSDPDSEATTAGQFGKMFTPEYASPEQILGKNVTTATDVYSLGVILYELLAQHRPFDVKGKSYNEVVKSVCETEPPRPSATLENLYQTEDERIPKTQIPKSRLRGDLDNIILKALRKEPFERYGSVQQLSEDVSRYLKGLPVSAHAQTYSYRFNKYYKRHKVGVLAAALVFISLLTGFSVASWQAIVARRERAKAEARFNDVRSLANSLMFDVHDSIKDLPGSTPARKLLVERALNYLDKLADESKNDMTLQTELAAGYEKIADVQGGALGSNLGDNNGALASYQKALAIREKLSRKGDSLEQRYAAATIHSKIFRVLMATNDFEKAEFHCRTAIQILNKLNADQPANLLYKVTAARSHLELGDLLVSIEGGSAGEAIKNYRKSIEIAESVQMSSERNTKLPDGLSMNEKILSITQMAYRRIGQNLEVENRSDEALEIYGKALEASRKLAAENDPPTPQAQIVLAISLGNVGRTQAKAGKHRAAIKNTKNMLDLCQKAFNADPQNHLASTQLSLAHGSLGYVYMKQGDFGNAIKHYQVARGMQEKMRENDSNDIYNVGNLGETLAAIGYVYEQIGNEKTSKESSKTVLKEAVEWYQRSLSLWLDLKQTKKLPGYYAGKIPEQQEAIKRCEAKLK